MKKIFLLKISNSGKVITLIEIIISTFFFIYGFIHDGEFAKVLKDNSFINLSKYHLAVVACVIVFFFLFACGKDILERIVEQVLFVGGNVATLFALFKVFNIPFFFIAEGFFLIITPAFSNKVLKIFITGIILEIIILLSFFYNKQVTWPKNKTRITLGYKERTYNDKCILNYLKIRNRYLTRQVYKCIIIIAIIGIIIMGIPRDFLSYLFIIAAIFIILSNDIYWKDEIIFFIDLRNRGCPFGNYFFCNIVASWIDDLLILIIIALIMHKVTILFLLYITTIEIYANLAYMFCSNRFKSTYIINGLLSSLVAFLGVIPLMNVILSVFIYKKLIKVL